MKRTLMRTAIVASIAAAGLAQNGRQARLANEEAAALRSSADTLVKSAARSKTGGSAEWELWRNITLGPGQNITFHSDMDFSNARAARVTLRSRNNDLPDIRLDAYWAVPQAEYYSVADVVDGNTFPYRNVGGATFPIYGNQFRLRIQNNGVSNIFLTQVVIFAPRVESLGP